MTPPTERTGRAPHPGIAGRLAALGVVLVAAWAATLVKAAREQIGRHTYWTERARQQQARALPVPPTRGSIRDRDGVDLAYSTDAVRLSLDLRAAKDTATAVRALGAIGADTTRLWRAIRAEQKWIPLPYPYLYHAADRALRVPGIRSQTTQVRVADTALPSLRALLGHVRDAQGTDGLERARNQQLSGRAGTALIYRSASGRPLSDTITVASATPGASLELTIARDLQALAEATLDEALRTYHATGGDVVLLDIPTGEVLALAARRNKTPVGATLLGEPFEPGSTIKPLLVGLALEAGVARPLELINTYGGTWSYLGRRFVDVHKGGVMSVREVLTHSSNVGMVQLMLRMPDSALHAGLRRGGLGRPLGLGVGAETRGVLRPVNAWSAQSKPSLAMGYECSTTLLHLASIYAALASDGVRRQPTLVRRVVAADGQTVWTHTPTPIDTLLRPATARQIQAMMLAAVDSGTGKLAKLQGIAVAGKTGTARLTRVGGKGYEARYAASFLGFVPASAPQYVLAIRLNEPEGMYGGATAAPVAKRFLEGLLAQASSGTMRGHPGLRALVEAQQHHTGAPSATPAANASDPVTLQRPSAPPEKFRPLNASSGNRRTSALRFPAVAPSGIP